MNPAARSGQMHRGAEAGSVQHQRMPRISHFVAMTRGLQSERAINLDGADLLSSSSLSGGVHDPAPSRVRIRRVPCSFHFACSACSPVPLGIAISMWSKS